MTPLFTSIRIALLVALVSAFVTGLLVVPAGTMLPVHWGPSGEADGFLPREWALLVPLLMVAVVWAIFLVVGRFGRPADIAAGRYSFGVVVTAITGLALVMEVATVLIGIGVPVNMVQVLGFALGALLVVLGNVMPKSQPNSLAGLRMPSTLNDPANWQATHRLTGFLCIIAGLVLIVAAALVPTPALIWWLLGCVFAPILIGVVYSIRYARRQKPNGL
ncbi:SdpI family protein [Devosia sp. ZB163]|uniref:SdpI family protein n=1 Tax=Devosia sp. ZB163 TaxID=3025938 RepID=UPI0023601633|nr:SdpI family protein [Devosia sp. ZB163]MDC9824325.1 SdpI family protein [Devosia sp. ZB163]